MTQTNDALQGWRMASRIAALASASIGCAAFAGWWLDVAWLRSWVPRMVPVNPVTAVLLAMSGAATALCCGESRARRVPAIAVSLLLLAVGGARLAAYLTGLDVGPDRWLFPSQLATLSGPNRMAPNTALLFLLIGLALLLLDVRAWRGGRPAQWAASAAGCIAAAGILGYAYGAEAFFRVSSFIPMALPTAVAMLLLSLALLLARPGDGFVSAFTSPHLGGIASRRLLPGVIVGPLVLGWLRLQGERRGLYPPEVGVALMGVAMVVMLVALVAWSARALDAASVVSQALTASFEAQARELARANEELEAFSYSVSHDLRAPLRHVVGFVTLLQAHAQGSLDEKSQGYLKIISEAARKMGCLIDDLLAFSRMGRASLAAQSVSLGDLAAEVIRELPAGERRIEWIVGSLPVVRADPALLRQVLVNLLGNAVKYTQPSETARIEIGSVESGAEHAIFVRDNGVGFDPAHAAKLFGVFQRLHSDKEFEGTGIGLALVQRIVQRHGGRAWAEAVPGEGATFWFSLPK